VGEERNEVREEAREGWRVRGEVVRGEMWGEKNREEGKRKEGWIA